MKILVATLKHETNTFSPIVTDLKRFEEWGLHRGQAARRAMADTAMPQGAYQRLATEMGAELVTPISAEAMPGGRVTAEAYRALCEPILDAVEQGVDVALLDLHGAMVAEGVPDGEGALLAAIRARSPTLPIAVTCDFHANLTEAMVDNATALIGYKTYPHTDMAEVAEQVGRIVLAAARGEVDPVMAWGRLPLLSQTLKQGTDDAPMRDLMALCRAQEADGLEASTLFGGFALSDVPHAGTSGVVVANGNSDQAQRALSELLEATWAQRADLVYGGTGIAQALVQARAAMAQRQDKLVALLDHADNCGSGGTQDVMSAVEAALPLGGVVVAAVWDPAAVRTMQAAGVGASVTLPLGGRSDAPALGLQGRPLTISGEVAHLSEGTFQIEGPMYTGVTISTGPTALLRVPETNAQIIVTSRHHEPWDAGLFDMAGVDLSAARFVVLKGRLHWRAGMGDLFSTAIPLDGTGVTTSDNARLPYARLSRPIFPLDMHVCWP